MNIFSVTSFTLGALVTFYTSLFMVEISLLLVKGKRIRATLMLLPFVSLLFNALFGGFNWLNPLNCNSCIQKVFFPLLIPDLKAHLDANEISLINHLYRTFEGLQGLFNLLLIAFGTLSLFFILQKLGQIYLQTRALHVILQKGKSFSKINAKLANAMEVLKVNLIISPEISIPMALYNQRIVLPQKVLEEISPEGIESIMVHELEHIRWKDPLTRLFSELVSSLFWWVPTESWRKRLEQEQEMACDQGVLNYGLTKESLASTLIEVSRQAKQRSQEAPCFFATPKNASWIRLQAILGMAPKDKTFYTSPVFFALCLEALLLLFCFYGYSP